MKDPREENYKPPRTLYVNASFTLMKNSIPVVTNDYDTFADGSVNLFHTNWKESYKEDHYTIMELLRELERYVDDELNVVAHGSLRSCELSMIKQDLQGWYVESEHFEEG